MSCGHCKYVRVEDRDLVKLRVFRVICYWCKDEIKPKRRDTEGRKEE